MALRLVSRDWNAASTPFVFDHIKLRLFPSSMEKFNKLCHSGLAKHVRTLDFHADLLPVWDKETWLSNALHSEPNTGGLPRHVGADLQEEAYDESTRLSLSDEELDAGWAAYEKHMLSQQRWHKERHNLRLMLEHALLRLPNLCRSTVACCPSPYELRRYCFQGFSQEPFLEILAREIIVPSKLWLVWLTPKLSNIKHVELEDACALAYVQAIRHRSQHSEVKQIKTLTLDLKSQQTLSKLSAASEHPDHLRVDYISNRQDILQAFTATTNLTLRLREALAYVTDRDNQTEDLLQILKVAKDLRVLHLECGNFYNDEVALSSPPSIGKELALTPALSNPAVTYHNLKELFLSAVVPGQALAGFLKLHSPTLKRLELRRSISDDWETVLYTIASHLNLDQLRLYWLVDGYRSHFDGQSWIFKRFEEGTCHFHFEQRLYWDGTPEDFELLQRLDCVQFRGAMKKFFYGKGSLKLPPEFYTEWDDLRQWTGPIINRRLGYATLRGSN